MSTAQRNRRKPTKKSNNTLMMGAAAAIFLLLLIVIIVAVKSRSGGEKQASDPNNTVAPVIELTSNADHYTVPHHAYEEEGFIATDDVDGDITDRVVSYQGNGKVYYYVSDSAGNTTTVTRNIVYDDRTAPVITLEGGDAVTVTAGSSAELPGYSARDDGDGDVTDRVQVSGGVNTMALGTYTMTYAVTDSFGNTATATRTVTVVDDGSGTYPESNGHTIYLTFDDGPSQYTPELLEILAKYNVQATFFTCNTDYVDIMRDEIEQGHAVAVHSATHDYSKIYSGVDPYFDDFNRQRQLIYDYTGVWTNLLRFPGGSSNTVSRKYATGIMTTLTQAVTERGYYYFDWDVTSGDAGDTTDTDVIYSNIVGGIARMASDGKDAVVLQHDTKKFSIDAVERVIQWGLENGYSFSALSETSPESHQHINN